MSARGRVPTIEVAQRAAVEHGKPGSMRQSRLSASFPRGGISPEASPDARRSERESVIEALERLKRWNDGPDREGG